MFVTKRKYSKLKSEFDGLRRALPRVVVSRSAKDSRWRFKLVQGSTTVAVGVGAWDEMGEAREASRKARP